MVRLGLERISVYIRRIKTRSPIELFSILYWRVLTERYKDRSFVIPSRGMHVVPKFTSRHKMQLLFLMEYGLGS